MELFRLFGTVLIEDQDAINTLKKIDDKGKKTKTGLQDIADKGAKIGAAVAAGSGAAVGGLLAMANSTSESAAKYLELSQRTDIGIESLERWGYAASQSGADIGKLEVGMKKLSSNIVDATSKSGASRDAFKKLGISMTDLSKMSPEQAFDTVMNKLADMPNSAEKNVVGNQLLGKSYTELKTLLSEGSDGMQTLKDKADKLGIVMSGDSVVAAEGFGDTMDDVKLSFDGVKNKIVLELLPQLTKMLNWFISKSPQIQSVAGTALGFISKSIGFIADKSNIIIPILGGLAGAFLALKVIGIVNGLMTAYTTFTTTATGVQMGLNAALMANPIPLIIAAIAAVIAIGVALVMNWDKIKDAAGKVGSWIGEKWDGIKAKTAEVWGNVKDAIGTAVGAAKDTVKEKLNNMKTAFEENGGGLKGTVAAAWEGIKGYYSAGFTFVDKLSGGKLTDLKNKFGEKFGEIKDKTSEVWGNVKDKIGSVMSAAKETVKEKLGNMKTAFESNGGGIKGTVSAAWEGIKGFYSAGLTFIDKLTGGKLTAIKKAFTDKIGGARDFVEKAIGKIKGFFDFKWELPKIKLPHFEITGKFSLNPPSIPKFSVDWFANGGIFSKPTIFNTPYGLKGVGEAGTEVVAPLSELKSMLGLNKQNKEVNLNVNWNIENFNNNSDKDIEDMADQFAFLAKRKLEGSGVFA